MSDFIPPLISSSPPPMPEFDDEDEDDIEFGINVGYNIGDLDIPGVIDAEKKDKVLEIDNKRLEINGIANNWRCEEQDSTSQDSGLCMASHGSEGMSPLPQSDDEDKQIDNNNINMKHSSTVMFNSEETSNESEKTFNEVPYCNGGVGVVLVSDTGQLSESSDGQDRNSFLQDVISSASGENGVCPLQNDDDFDAEFVWSSSTVVNDESDLFQEGKINEVGGNEGENVDIISCKEKLNREEVNGSACTKDGNNTFCDVSNEIPFVKDFSSAVDSCSSVSNVKEALSLSDNNICDSSVIVDSTVVMSTDQSEFYFNKLEQNNELCMNNEDDDDDDDDFGNFTSVTNVTNCDSVFNNDISFSNHKDLSSISEHTSESVLPNKQDAVGFNEIQGDSESHLEINDCDIVVKHRTLVTSEVAESDDAVGLGNKSDRVSKDDDKSGFDNSSNWEEDDDDFDDFSDFTNSTPCRLEPDVKMDKISVYKPPEPQESLEFAFPKLDSTDSSDVYIEQLEYGPVWKYLCPLENSPALTFQWSNSRAHNQLLTALSIDSRNILFGPHWNANIPRFAANLGSNPLQPVKAVETPLTMTGSSSPVPSVPEEQSVVPDAHFDWVSSGLTNPLDCVQSKTSSDNIEQLKGSRLRHPVKKVKHVLSTEAESIISLLPDLNFIRKSYIEVLINKEE